MVYRKKTVQRSFESLGEALGTPLSTNNHWVQLAEVLPWAAMEEVYQSIFPSKLGRAAKPFRLLYGAQLIKQKYGWSDVRLVAMIRDTPAFQHFVGIDDYQASLPFEPSTLTKFRKRIAPISELLRQIVADDVRAKLIAQGVDVSELIIDATAVPVNIKFPQDTHLLNQSRLDLEKMIDDLRKQLAVNPPRTYKRTAQKEWNNYSRHLKQQRKHRQTIIQHQLQYVKRDLRYVKELRAQGGQLADWQTQQLETIQKVYEQHSYMFEHQTHQVADRIVNLDQPFIRPIKRGKAKQPTEFGAKIDLSMTGGILELERFDFNNFHESMDLKAAIDHHWDLYGQYPTRVLVDKTYRNRANRAYCEARDIEMPGSKPGRPPKHPDPAKKKAMIEAENRRGAIERRISYLKFQSGLSLVKAKRIESIAVTVDFAIVNANLDPLLTFLGVPILIGVQDGSETIMILYRMMDSQAKLAG